MTGATDGASSGAAPAAAHAPTLGRRRRCSPTGSQAAHLRVRRAGRTTRSPRRSSCCREHRSRSPTVVRACADAGVPFVARGSGTGLSGGALPHADGVLVVTSRMRDILEVDPPTSGPSCEPGVINLRRHHGRRAARLLLRARPVQPAGLLDRRQRRRELRRRALPEVRLHHQPRARRSSWSRPTASVVQLGGPGAGRRPATTCSARSSAREGTLGVATEVTVRLIRRPEAVRTLLAGVPVAPTRPAPPSSAIIGAGVVPGGDRDDGRAGDRGRRGGGALRLPGGRRRGAGRRARRPGRRGRGAVRRGGAALPGQRRVRDPASPPTTPSGR